MDKLKELYAYRQMLISLVKRICVEDIRHLF